ncbi:sensor histidine kinase [Enterococcus sp. BWR-S5]|uniref:sensor histidine kinase n=1 Tax=Enterococcus sp. BWR-S5 TaxID=2787714 RepID=UPI001922BE13|nr:histidine kinase [Enterococcus sp. BWR-S5]MBL1227181.1 sensor histidine kinase [Enterococcus sp. BWR-S5]
MNTFKLSNFIEKGVLLFFGFMLLVSDSYQSERVIFILLSLLLSMIVWVLQQPKLSAVAIFILLAASYWWKEYVFFVPFLFYDGFYDENYGISIINTGLLSVFLLFNEQYSVGNKFFIGGLCFIAAYMAYRHIEENRLAERRQQLEDELLSLTYSLQQQKAEREKRQETLISLEVSNERNRIARDIHDNVGHLLSSSLLQIGAIQTISQQETLQAPLNQLKETVTEGMNNIRVSVHDLHDESLHLSIAMQKIVENFQFCDIQLVGEFPEYLDKECKLGCIMIVKEALSNVMKHSNASDVTISFKQQPGFYKLTISDNGTRRKIMDITERGIGLTSMEERLSKLGGRLNHHQTETGFSLIAVFPKYEGENI